MEKSAFGYKNRLGSSLLVVVQNAYFLGFNFLPSFGHITIQYPSARVACKQCLALCAKCMRTNKNKSNTDCFSPSFFSNVKSINIQAPVRPLE